MPPVFYPERRRSRHGYHNFWSPSVVVTTEPTELQPQFSYGMLILFGFIVLAIVIMSQRMYLKQSGGFDFNWEKIWQSIGIYGQISLVAGGLILISYLKYLSIKKDVNELDQAADYYKKK